MNDGGLMSRRQSDLPESGSRSAPDGLDQNSRTARGRDTRQVVKRRQSEIDGAAESLYDGTALQELPIPSPTPSSSSVSGQPKPASASGRHFRGGRPASEPTPKTTTDSDGESRWGGISVRRYFPGDDRDLLWLPIFGDQAFFPRHGSRKRSPRARRLFG
jgi:hypothetical protein